MKVFHCDHCRHLVFFENTLCVKCEKRLAYLPELGVVGSLDQSPDANLYSSPLPRSEGRRYKLCANYLQHNICNWAMAADDQHSLCTACRLTRTIPDLTRNGHRVQWAKLETAKRRLVYTLQGLKLPVASKDDDPENGLRFEFLADADPNTPQPILTGHESGTVTVNIAEADDAEREKRRVQLGEPYRTLPGHLRHEVGHYYWNRLIEGTTRLDSYRNLFGDERADYGEALKAHYRDGPAPDWPHRFVSSYAASHPWEDWAETWAHYLHIVDTLETAADCGLSIRPARPDEPRLASAPDPIDDPDAPFDRIMESWFPLTYVLNNLNRGLGHPDAYPFVLPPKAVEKLRFIHDTIAAANA